MPILITTPVSYKRFSKSSRYKNVTPTPEQLKDAFSVRCGNKADVPPTGATFFIAFDEFVREEGKLNNWTTATYTMFGVVKRHLQNFNPALTFNDLNEAGLSDYVSYMRDVRQMRNNTITKQIGFLKWFLRWALKKGHTDNVAFERFRPKFRSTPKKVIFLTWDELTRLRGYNIPATKQYLDRVRDVFLFSCFTGLRYSDVYNLRRSDIKGEKIEITTVKTADSLTIELNDHSRAILVKYADVHFEGDKVLPVISRAKKMCPNLRII